MKSCPVIILAGGKGTRLYPYTADTPKPLVTVRKTPVIELVIASLKRRGFTDLHLAVNHHAERIEAHLGDGSRYGVKIEYHHEDKELSTAAPLKLIPNLPGKFMVMNGDVITDLDYGALLADHKSSDALLTIATRVRIDRIDYGVIVADDNAEVVGFREKPEIRNRVSMGVYLFSKKALDYIPDNQPFGFDQLMRALLDSDQRIRSFDHNGFWMDIGRIEDYELANQQADHIHRLLID